MGVYQTKPFMFVSIGSQFVERDGEPGMIHRDAHNLGIAAIAGNRGNGEFDGHWLALVIKHVGMSKIGGLTHVVALSEKEGRFALYMLEERDVRGASHGPKLSDASVPHVFPKPVSKVGDTPYARVGSRLDAFPNCPTMSRTRPPVACRA
ncbi:uncharacterized protein TNCV_903331 [Trichonephila clavipes]|nr:uncharacterized protein TNCV_903331 [Trichonephila clavipes]